MDVSEISTKEYLNDAYNSVKKFNSVAGNLSSFSPADTERQITTQLKLIMEELKEAIAAHEAKDATELLKETQDVFVTWAGLNQILEQAGANAERALGAVCENNMTKFVPAAEFYADDHKYLTPATASVSQSFGRIVLKNVDGKVIKPKTYQSVDIQDYTANIYYTGN